MVVLEVLIMIAVLLKESAGIMDCVVPVLLNRRFVLQHPMRFVRLVVDREAIMIAARLLERNFIKGILECMDVMRREEWLGVASKFLMEYARRIVHQGAMLIVVPPKDIVGQEGGVMFVKQRVNLLMEMLEFPLHARRILMEFVRERVVQGVIMTAARQEENAGFIAVLIEQDAMIAPLP